MIDKQKRVLALTWIENKKGIMQYEIKVRNLVHLFLSWSFIIFYLCEIIPDILKTCKDKEIKKWSFGNGKAILFVKVNRKTRFSLATT